MLILTEKLCKRYSGLAFVSFWPEVITRGVGTELSGCCHMPDLAYLQCMPGLTLIISVYISWLLQCAIWGVVSLKEELDSQYCSLSTQ